MSKQDRDIRDWHSLEQEFDGEAVPPPVRVPVFDLGQLVECLKARG